MNPEGLVLLIPLAGIGLGGLFLVGVYKLLARWMDRRGGGDGAGLLDEVAKLREVVEELRDVNQRVLELEERLDFAERLLAQAKQDRLPAGGESGR